MKARLFLVFNLFFIAGFSQNLSDSISEKFYRDIEQRYLQPQVLSYRYHVNQFDSTGTVILKSISGMIYQSKSKFFYDLDDVKVAFEDSFYLVVYPKKKEMYYHVLTDKMMAENQNVDIRKFVEQLKNNQMRVMIDSTCIGSKIHSCYYLVHGSLSKDLYKIRVNKSTGYIDYVRIDYYGSSDKNTIDNYVMEIKYSEYQVVDSKKFFPLQEFVQKKNGVLTKSKQYTDFELNKF